jgi:hypothetical protein
MHLHFLAQLPDVIAISAYPRGREPTRSSHHRTSRSLHLAVGADVVFPLALRDPFALGVVQRETVRTLRRLHKCRMRRRRISDVSGMYRRTISRGGQETDGNKGAH